MGDLDYLKFRFDLDSVEEIAPWGKGDDRTLHWFGLTSGRYWISTPVGEALRYTDQKIKDWNRVSPYVDYFVARFFEDLQERLPRILEPVPPDMAAIVANPDWYACADYWRDAGTDEDGRWDTWYDATEWWHQRELDTGYLVNGPSFHMWRVRDAVNVRWHPTGENLEYTWAVPNGEFSLSAASFRSAAFSFFEELLGLMQKRVELIQTQGWNREDCRVDIPLLLREQQKRTAWINDLKDRTAQTEWESARSRLDRLCSELRN